MRIAILVLIFFLVFGCTQISATEKLISDSALKANSLDSYTLEYKRLIVSYVASNESIHMIPETTITKHKRGTLMRWDVLDWLGAQERLYLLEGKVLSCELNGSWLCKQVDSQRMHEFMGFDVLGPSGSVRRLVASQAILLGEIKEEEVYGRKSKCFAAEIYPEKFSNQDWEEFALGAITREAALGMNELKAWQCLDSETGLKTELVLNYKAIVDGEKRTVEVSVKLSGIDLSPALEEKFFELPN
jgi:hypothetical protein